jgi:hypothetical protein
LAIADLQQPFQSELEITRNPLPPSWPVCDAISGIREHVNISAIPNTMLAGADHAGCDCSPHGLRARIAGEGSRRVTRATPATLSTERGRNYLPRRERAHGQRPPAL